MATILLMRSAFSSSNLDFIDLIITDVKTLLCVLLSIGWINSTQAVTIGTPVNRPIPDGDLSGLVSTINLGGLSDPVANVQVYLNISGTFNGDLYAYLTHGMGFSVLLNRVGRTATDGIGYGDAGLDVTFADSASDIHNYRLSLAANDSVPSGWPLTGTWGPDGRTISPEAVTDADPRNALLSSFEGLDPNGQWTLFVADLSGGDVHQLNSWGLEVNAPIHSVPEPENRGAAGLVFVGIFGLILCIWRWRSSLGPAAS